MRTFGNKMVIYDLHETYCNIGWHEFKIVLGKSFKNGHDIEIEVLDPSSNLLDVEIEVWGRKVNCGFLVDEETDDGVCVLKIKCGSGLDESIQFWVIK